MKVVETEFEGVFEISILPKVDDRGFFVRTYDKDIFHTNKINYNWVQENKSFSKQSGTIRGMHFQFSPYTETKLISVSKGKILDVILDLRNNSKTFGKCFSTIISEENSKSLLVPRGFAHGFCTLEDDTKVCYKVDNYYMPKSEGGIIWNDSSLKIDWPVDNPIISEKDSKLITFKEFLKRLSLVYKKKTIKCQLYSLKCFYNSLNTSVLCCLINHSAESGLSCLFDKGTYFLIFFSLLEISTSISLILKGLF